MTEANITSFVYADADEVNNEVNIQRSIESDLSLMEQRGHHNLINRKRKGDTMDTKLDKDEVDQDLTVRNINEMIKAKLPIIEFPES